MPSGSSSRPTAFLVQSDLRVFTRQVMANSRFSPENPPQELLDDVRRRLAGVCSHWPPELFAEVTMRAAWIEFKYDRAMTDSFAAARLRELRETEVTWSARV
jgi:hypothetical protein